MTVSETEQAKRQEIFDTAYRGLASQGFERSTNAVGDCVYRDPSGRRCAVGWCISEDKYDVGLESMCTNEVVDLVGGFDIDIAFVYAMQTSHDRGDEPEKMKGLLQSFATDYNLTIPSLHG